MELTAFLLRFLLFSMDDRFNAMDFRFYAMDLINFISYKLTAK